MLTMTAILEIMNNFLYGYILIILLVGTGIYFTIRSKAVQFRMLPEAIRLLMEPKQGAHSISSFQALMVSTASRVGTGNIAGVATALAAGGPGAIFWMWIMALMGGASAFIESTLAQVYKIKDRAGFRGGPAYFIQYGLGKRWLGVIFAVLLILCFAYGFNGLQAFNATSAFHYYTDTYFVNEDFPMVMGLVMAMLTAIVIFGGVERISFVSAIIVPVMAFGYIGVGIYIVGTNIGALGQVFRQIMVNAFDVQAIFGGFAGSCVVVGIKRGLFSNEAGMGSAPNAAATATVSHPAKQGLVQMLSVFIDTLIICSTTAFIILVGDPQGLQGLDGMPLIQQAVYQQLGNVGIHFITLAILTFAFSSIIGNYYYAESNLLFIIDHKVVLLVFRLSVIATVFVGSMSSFDFVWNLADILMGMMALVNIGAIVCLGNIALKVLQDYTSQKKRGNNPVFYARDIDLDNTEQWK